MQSRKTSDKRITMWSYDNRDKHNNSEESFPTSIVPHFPDTSQIQRYIYPKPLITPIKRDTAKVLFKMSSDESLVSQYRKTPHSSSCYQNDYDEIKKKVFKCLWVRKVMDIVINLFQLKTSTFQHALSFECTTKLCINFLNQFSVYFYI